MKSLTFLAAIAALIIGFSACDRVPEIIQPATPEAEDQSDTISIGVVLPLTGHLAASGELMQHGFDLALNEINNAPPGRTKLNYIVVDDTSTPEGAIAAFRTLIHQAGVSVIIGPASSSATEAAFPIAQENQVVAISPTSGARGLSAIGDFVFRIALTTDVIVSKGIEATHAQLGYQRVATIYDETDLFSTDRDKALQEAFAANGIDVLTTETFQSGDTDFSEQLTRIKALNPDAIFVSALPPEKPRVLIQGHQLDISALFVVSSLTDVEVQAAGAAAEGAITFTGWLSTDDTPGNQAFVQNYSATFGMEPNVFAVSSYATVHILAEALKNATSTDSIAIRDALATLSDLDTILGKFSFDPNGDAIYAPKALIVQDGALQPFE